ncbi:MAG: exo-beta-N-acetylmuramidase NamZ domain-containing protein [Bacteroidota bacterium]
MLISSNHSAWASMPFGEPSKEHPQSPICGADRYRMWLPELKGKKIGLMVNPTSRVGRMHLVDFMRKKRVDVQVVFAPEHGFRGEAQAGEAILDGRDPATGIRVVSLYGKSVKPKPLDLSGLDAVVFDIQDVGFRFYTYLSILHDLMQACADQNIPLWLFDRPTSSSRAAEC